MLVAKAKKNKSQMNNKLAKRERTSAIIANEIDQLLNNETITGLTFQIKKPNRLKQKSFYFNLNRIRINLHSTIIQQITYLLKNPNLNQ